MSLSRHATIVSFLVLGVGFAAPIEAGQTVPLLLADATATNDGAVAETNEPEEASTSAQAEPTPPAPVGFQRLNDDWPQWAAGSDFTTEVAPRARLAWPSTRGETIPTISTGFG